MSIAIDKDKCIGCSNCTRVCPGGLIYQDESGKAYIKYPKDCWGCTACIKSCPVNAISFYLGAELGGRGGQMTAKDMGEKVVWTIESGGETTEIEIKRSESNKY